jgi:nicotinamidase-related amidase
MGGSGSGGDINTGGSSGDGGTGTGGTSTVSGSIGVVVIDVQETFVSIAANPDKPAVIERTKSAMQLATQHQVPFFLTFEDSKSGSHALHAPLQSFLPAQTQEFIKTTFAATGLSSFASAMGQSGLSHVLVLGAETDVCVMQTVLGLRQMGFTVLLQKDGVLSSEPHTSPALRRMQQAGVILVDEAQAASYVANPNALPQGQNVEVRITQPLTVGVVLNAFTSQSVTQTPDPLASQKSARLRELLLVSEWFDLPVYVDDPAAGLPSQFAQYYQGMLRPISQIDQNAQLQQLVFAGTDTNLASVIGNWMGSKQAFVMEDAVLSQGPQPKELLASLYEGGLVPTTYKAFYYDMTKSVSLAEWPSQSWVQKFDQYYYITQAPEDLPPMPAD